MNEYEDLRSTIETNLSQSTQPVNAPEGNVIHKKTMTGVVIAFDLKI